MGVAQRIGLIMGVGTVVLAVIVGVLFLVLLAL